MKLINLKIWYKNIEFKRFLWLSFIVFVNQSLWIFLSYKKFRIGFPLDDAWIHQTYARNFVENFRWEYSSGIASGGSTSPLWTVLLMPGYFIKNNFYLIWTFFLGMVITIVSAYIFEDIIRLINKNYQKFNFPIFGFIFALEWHFVWAANSGMETMLFILFILIAIYLILSGKIYNISFAILLGLLLWVRPDAISFVGVYLSICFFNIIRDKKFEKKILLTIGILILSILLFMGFNKIVAGTILPNTFYAKQAEYSVLYEIAFFKRLFRIMLVPITGIGAILIPGFVYQLFRVVKDKDFKLAAIVLWFFGYMLLFAMRLPVTYQHGRYFIPLIPIYLLFGISGYLSIKNEKLTKISRIFIKSWEISAISILLIFLALGANAYSQDVAIIESEMVDTALWVNSNIPKTSIIAAHDIGALGYFCDFDLIDLAGLISPEVIPFISDEEKLESFLYSKKVEYIVVFPNWYSNLVDRKKVVYQGINSFSSQAGGENMTVYKWKD